MLVYVILHDNYGDQGYDFHGVFESHKAAVNFVEKHEPRLDERQFWRIIEAPVQP